MTATTSLPEADLPGIRTLIGQLRAKGHRRGTLAVAAAPTWSGPHTVELDGARVRIRTAPSVLAIRDALTERSRYDWVVVLTDREAAELPVGVLDHLTAGRLSNFDPWPPCGICSRRASRSSTCCHSTTRPPAPHSASSTRPCRRHRAVCSPATICSVLSPTATSG
ncbi:hypothetical protein GS455_10340 [Rhodococcus hoagii]|nr:hypothetical protein [Prescottella equi]